MVWRVLAAFVLLLASLPGATLTIEPSSSAVTAGSSINLSVDISGVTDLYAFQFNIGFDPSILSAISVNEGPFLPSGGTTSFAPGSIDNVAGTISLTLDSLIGAIPGVSGDGALATLPFGAIGIGTTSVSISNVVLLDSNLNDIDFSIVNGSVEVSPNIVAEPGSAPSLILGLLMLFPVLLRRRRVS